MNEYNIKLDTELNHRCVDGTPASEEEILLQIWQDLKRINSKHTEDNVIKSVLEQIMIQKYNGEENIPFPDYYEEKE